MKILQITTALVTDAPGRIAEEIGKVLISGGHENYIGYGRFTRPIVSVPVKIGNTADRLLHVLKTRISDRHGFGSASATKKFIGELRRIDPDVIHLHNLHGYYLNIEILFDYLKTAGKPILWTLHDCWSFTGHCSHYDLIGCEKWKTTCYSCPNTHAYPASWFVDNSTENYNQKRNIFAGVRNLNIVTPSAWLKNQVSESFLKDYRVTVLPNGVDMDVFRPLTDHAALKKRYGLTGKKIILGVASFWGRHKGLDDFVRLGGMISEDEKIVLIGLNRKQQEGLPANITGISRTENVEELVAFYAAADVFVNPTYADTFPTTNLEALACGTPVITYNTGGSPESLDKDTGLVVEKGDITGLSEAIHSILQTGKSVFSEKCRSRALSFYNKEDRYLDYVHLYAEIIKKTGNGN